MNLFSAEIIRKSADGFVRPHEVQIVNNLVTIPTTNARNTYKNAVPTRKLRRVILGIADIVERKKDTFRYQCLAKDSVCEHCNETGHYSILWLTTFLLKQLMISGSTETLVLLSAPSISQPTSIPTLQSTTTPIPTVTIPTTQLTQSQLDDTGSSSNI